MASALSAERLARLAAPAALVVLALLIAVRCVGLLPRAHAALRSALTAASAKRRLAHKARILWGLRGMRTAPGSLGVLLFGHTYALARATGRYPCTWDLFSIWSQATAPVRARVRAACPQPC